MQWLRARPPGTVHAHGGLADLWATWAGARRGHAGDRLRLSAHTPRKGHAALLEALPAIWRRSPETVVLMVSDGSERGELMRRTAALGRPGRVR